MPETLRGRGIFTNRLVNYQQVLRSVVGWFKKAKVVSRHLPGYDDYREEEYPPVMTYRS